MRLLAALLAPLVAVIALLNWVPTNDATGLFAVSDLPAAEALQRNDQKPADLDALSRSATDRSTSRATTARAAEVEPPLPLTVTMDVLTPGVVPKRGPIVVRGRIINRSVDTWTDLNIYACTSHNPLTTAAQVEEAVATESSAVTCGRTTVFATIKTLAAGKSKRYHLRVPRDELGIDTAAGVYWFSVQALGSSPAGRDSTADGIVRSFLPLVEKPKTRAEVSMVLPLRRSTAHTVDGRLADPDGWARDLRTGGRLANLLHLAEQAPDDSISLLTDPAVITAAQQLADGNLPRSLGPTEVKSIAGVDAASSSEAAAWVARFRAVASKQRLLSLPYGDLDVAGASEADGALLVRALSESAAVFSALDLNASPVVSPPSGLLPTSALPTLNHTTVLLSDAALPAEVAAAPDAPNAVLSQGSPVRLYSASLARGGPTPTSGVRALALRQRVLADAAVRALADDDRPMLVVLPDDANPGGNAASFFAELGRNFVNINPILNGTEPAPEVGNLTYSAHQAAQQVNSSLFRYADELVDLGHSLDVLLPRVNNVATNAVREALSAASYQSVDADGSSAAALSALTSTVSWFSTRLNKVTMVAPRFVILSSGSGPFAPTITNGLDQPIRISIRAVTDKGLVIRAPRSIDVPAASSRTVNLEAEATAIGVHHVVLVATDADGRTIQKSAEFSIRTNSSGRVVWVIMAVGASLLFGAIILRLIRRRKNRA
jgi:hypothetical protein